MSYAIEYDRIFIRSGFGYTPLWLSSDNNVYVTSRKRARSWSVFGRQLGVSKQALLTFIEPMLGGYQEHWRKNGKWVDDAGLKRWIENGCKSAATIEELLKANNRSRFHFSLRVYPKRDETHDGFTYEEQLQADVSTTQDFDRWIADAKAVTAERKAEGADVYPYVDFYCDKIVHPNSPSISAERVILKGGLGYLIEPPTPKGSTWSADIRKAWVFTREEADAMQQADPHGNIGTAKRVDAVAKDKPFDAVIRFANGRNEGMYIQKFKSRSASLCHTIEYAYHYPDAKAAERALKTAQKKYRDTLEVVIDPDAAKYIS